eukprot:TRINITY_DN1632_c0_g1_i1.p1 TRINITY_DN1632_c0_g1~~TRINITY_DN1632_c0_g1_i1.p1  ORF type:complete len:1148 (-),score=446.33 TRINITY_DN1632_c0_g1_i1:653-4018(-)
MLAASRSVLRSGRSSVKLLDGKIPNIRYVSSKSGSQSSNPFAPLDVFEGRHIGPRPADIEKMVKSLGFESLDAMTRANVPKAIQLPKPLRVARPRAESEQEGRLIRQLWCCIGLSYHRMLAASRSVLRSGRSSVKLLDGKIPNIRYVSSKSGSQSSNPFAPLDVFEGRHIGPRPADIEKMVKSLGFESLDAMTRANVPKAIQLPKPLRVARPRAESEMLAELKQVASKNKVLRSFIGMGYYGTITPAVILRNILENPGWYTQYTPYQAEVSQGRLESLLNYQTMICDLTGMAISNASLLDEGTAAAEAMNMTYQATAKGSKGARKLFFVSDQCHPQNIEVVRGRAGPIGVEVVVGNHETFDFSKGDVCGALVQYPTTDGRVLDYSGFVKRVHDGGAMAVVSADLLALTTIKSPGELGFDVAIGSAQRFGVPLGYGGPHAAYYATTDKNKRTMPGRLIGISKDAQGNTALRMALQTREQHIRRETATSNICTAQALLANTAAMYAVYHGPKGLKAIADRVHLAALTLAAGLQKLGFETGSHKFFDTVRVELGDIRSTEVLQALVKRGINVRALGDSAVTISLDETVSEKDLLELLSGFAEVRAVALTFTPASLVAGLNVNDLAGLARSTPYLTHPNFNSFHSETEMLRYLKRLENKDVSLAHSMIPLGSCTMKLNATTEMIPITWPEFGQLHPFVPLDQAAGYMEMFETLSKTLTEITGFDALSLQPNAGSQGEYAGLRVIRAYFADRGESHRNVCLIPTTAHGTNPASAVMAGFKVVVVKSNADGSIDMADLRQKADQHKDQLACVMVTYPSTNGVFEGTIKEICEIVHARGGQVYMDGANMNSQVGITSPGFIGADVCHLNLHKTFCIPHGGGGPGMGPIGVKQHLAPYLPKHSVVDMGRFGGTREKGIDAISAAPFGSGSILPISHVYIQMMGGEGLTRATQVAILSANYMAQRVKDHYKVMFSNGAGLVAHEFIIDTSPFGKSAHIGSEDIAKRLMDYGFHAPTMSWPQPDSLMIEPTESESKEELDRLVDALISIRAEIREIEEGRAHPTNNVLKNAPHTASVVISDKWDRPYSREQAAFPAPWSRLAKVWPTVGRVDNTYGDRNLVCSCPPVDTYA